VSCVSAAAAVTNSFSLNQTFESKVRVMRIVLADESLRDKWIHTQSFGVVLNMHSTRYASFPNYSWLQNICFYLAFNLWLGSFAVCVEGRKEGR